jgi:hypothetical protein
MYFGFNEHYQGEADNANRELLTVLSERWRQYHTWSKETAQHLMDHLTAEST